MSLIDRIFDRLDGPTAIARATGFPVQTVHSWKVKGDIPHWRRAALIAAAQRGGKTLDPDCAAYLAGNDKADTQEQVRAA